MGAAERRGPRWFAFHGSGEDSSGSVPYGDGPEYWDLRYKVDSEPFDWLRDFSELKAHIEACCPRSGDILNVGCGNSLLSEEMYDNGYHNIVNIDCSSVVIALMKERNASRPSMAWQEMDALDAQNFEGLGHLSRLLS
ncbi:unnamed protein product [Effrenium voratum]|nr:unnamed protein product [Effrenium voratum]